MNRSSKKSKNGIFRELRPIFRYCYGTPLNFRNLFATTDNNVIFQKISIGMLLPMTYKGPELWMTLKWPAFYIFKN